MATRGFDDSNIAWNTLEGIPDVWYHILDIDDANRIVDILFKFSARSRIVLHRHRTDYRTFVIQGELRLYNAENELTRSARSAATSPKPRAASRTVRAAGTRT